jgi:signal transduction histidine kinase
MALRLVDFHLDVAAVSAPEELARLQNELAALARERDALLRDRALLHRSLELHERDRQLLAFEIHDGIVQDMSGVVMLLESAARQATFTTPAAQELFERAVRTQRESVAEARRLIRGLIPVVLDQAGFVVSLQKLTQRFAEEQQIQVTLQTSVQLKHLAPAFEMIILRIVQEALNNVWRHSGAEQADVTVTQQGDQLLLTISDAGAGFDPTQVKTTRYGLTGMKERARLLGGSTQIESAPGKGTRVSVTMPLAQAVVDEH